MEDLITIDQRINEGKADEMDGSFKFTEDGTYRVVKDVYGYMSSMRNFLFEAKSNEVTIEDKKEDKKEKLPSVNQNGKEHQRCSS